LEIKFPIRDRVYLAMEMVDGIDLDSYIKRAGSLDEVIAWRSAGHKRRWFWAMARLSWCR